MSGSAKPSAVEATKAESRRLRGAIAADLADASPQVSEGSYNLLKFHGTYEQFDRDTATERKQRGEEKDWQFMVRVRSQFGSVSCLDFVFIVLLV